METGASPWHRTPRAGASPWRCHPRKAAANMAKARSLFLIVLLHLLFSELVRRCSRARKNEKESGPRVTSHAYSIYLNPIDRQSIVESSEQITPKKSLGRLTPFPTRSKKSRLEWGRAGHLPATRVQTASLTQMLDPQARQREEPMHPILNDTDPARILRETEDTEKVARFVDNKAEHCPLRSVSQHLAQQGIHQGAKIETHINRTERKPSPDTRDTTKRRKLAALLMTTPHTGTTRPKTHQTHKVEPTRPIGIDYF